MIFPKNKKLFTILVVILFLLSVIFSCVLFPILQKPPYPEGQIIYYIGNLHTHTIFSDGKMSYEELIESAKKLNFEFIAITDHNLINPEIKSSCLNEKRILCLVGEEITSNKGHILAIDIREPIPQGLSPEETIKMIHQQGGLAIIAHPGRSLGLSIEEAKKTDADAVECSLSSKTDNNTYNCESLPSFPHVFNSDAHRKEELSRLANRCKMIVLNLNNLKKAVKENNCFEFKPAF